MAGIYGISAYQQNSYKMKANNPDPERVGEKASSKAGPGNSAAGTSSEKTGSKGWSPIDTKSSLVPQKTEYGNTIGAVQLSDQAKEYYEKLKAKYHGMEFIAVSKDMKSQVQANAAAYGNANKTVVLIDEEKLERMASDESYRKKYEGIIAMSQTKLADMKNSLASSGAAVKNFGLSVDANGKESYFATVEKSQDLQKKRIEKKAAEKKELKTRERKKAEKQHLEERIEKAREKRSEKPEPEHDEIPPEAEKRIHDKVVEVYGKEYATIEADSMDDLLSKVQSYSYSNASDRVMTDAERMIGGRIDFRG